MKLITEKSTIQTNVDQSQSMNFGIGDVRIVIDILRNRLYKNKTQTTVQEYVSNARDANREMKTDKKIVVTFPSVSIPEFKVRDFGPGISPERMADVFIKYGSSTKRGTNEFTGGLGIGCKSAFAYTDSFKITTFIDKVKRTYVASSEGAGSIILFGEEQTNEENGTEISITVERNDVDRFCSAIIRATMFWNEDEYPLFDNHSRWVQSINTARKIGLDRFEGTNISGLKSSEFTNCYECIVIDGIPYPSPNLKLTEEVQFENTIRSKSGGYIIHIPNGLVQVSANREEIDDSNVSVNALRNIFIAAKKSFDEAVDKIEEKVADLDSLIAVSRKSSDFKLSFKKTFDGVKFNNGTLFLDKYDNNERWFEFKELDSGRSRDANLSFTSTNYTYYITRKGSRSIKDIYKKFRGCHLVIIVGKKLVEETVDGETSKVWKRDDELVARLKTILSKLGVKNAEELIPLPPREKVEKVKAEREKYDIWEVNRYGMETKRTLDTLGEKEGTWVLFVGSKNDYNFKNEFTDYINDLMAVGDISRAFRITEKQYEKIKDDDRFIEFNEFKKSWTPSDKLIIRTLNYGFQYLSEISMVAGIDSNVDIVKFCKKFSELGSGTMHCWTLRNKVSGSKRYAELTEAYSNVVNLLKREMPMIFNYRGEKEHSKEYIEWKIEKSFSSLSALDLSKFI